MNEAKGFARNLSRRLSLTRAVAVLLCVLPGLAKAQGDVSAGEDVFRQCAACHATTADGRSSGPHLAGIVGRTAGTLEGARYSDALIASGIVWDADTLAAFLDDPAALMPGTTMRVSLRDPADMADLIAYLESL
jgi:cytochrome c